MAMLHKLRFLGPLPTLNRMYGVPVPVRAESPKPTRAPAPEASRPARAAKMDWSDPEVPLEDMRAELERRGVEVNARWNRATLRKRLEGE